VFYDPRALDPEGPSGVLHAKAVVADDEAVFITSANLTEAALDRNIELGVLIRDRAMALAVGGYFRSLIDRELLKPLPLVMRERQELSLKHRRRPFARTNTRLPCLGNFDVTPLTDKLSCSFL
jgi:phosphatidylserine/phosphatidylglycerophosphate/cardiolipin synthase-like enzyme